MRSFSLPWLIVVTACMLTADASCPFVEGAGQQTVPVSSALLRSARQASFDESCLGILLDRMKTKADRQQVDLVVELVETWSESHGFSMRLLSGISRLQAQRGDAETGKRIVALWEKRNKSFSAAVSEFSAAGRQGSADSLFRAVDRCMLLGPDALLRWARIKEVRGAFRQSAALHCRAMAGEPRIRSVALHQFSHLLENASRDSVRVALGELRRCIFSLPETDTSRMQQWIADAYARNGCDSEEIGVLTQFSPLSPSLVTRLLDIARIQYRRGNHSLAVIAARHCFDNAAEAHRMQTAAAVLCHAYDALGKADSSLYWVQRSDLSSEKGKIEAVALYQRRGRPADAEKLLHELRPSLARDTLAVRQRLFAGDIEGAGALVGTAAWNDHPREALLWKTRTLVFTARFDDLGPFFDTLRLDPAWENSKELIEYRYYWNLLSRERDARAAWAAIEADLYTGNAEQAVKRINTHPIPDELGAALLLRILRKLKETGDAARIVATVEDRGAQPCEPECRYRYAEALAATGNTAKARRLLLQLLHDVPSGVFSQKARILLAQLGGQS